jgi:hypothetical protein
MTAAMAALATGATTSWASEFRPVLRRRGAFVITFLNVVDDAFVRGRGNATGVG